MNLSTSSSQRMKTAFGAGLAAVAVLGTFATAQSADAATAQHPAKAARAPYVINHYGEENADQGRAERSPAHLVLSEFTSAQGLRWKQWDAKKAVATGRLSGTWCLPKCTGTGYPATIELSRLERRENVSYYTRAAVHSDRLPPGGHDGAGDLSAVRLPVPES